DLHDRLVGALELVGEQRVAEVRADVEVIDEENLDLLDAALAQLVELRFAELLVALEENFTGRVVDDVLRGHLADELVEIDREKIDARVLQLADRTLRELAVLLDEDFLRLRVLD